MINKYNGGVGGYFSTYDPVNHRIGLTVNDGASSYFVDYPWVAVAGEWHHLAISCDISVGADMGDATQLYIDGIPLADDSHSAGLPASIPDTANDFQVGRHWPDWPSVEIAHLRAWSGVLTQVEIQAEEASETVVRTSGLQGAWAFDGDALDASANGNDLTLYNGAGYLAGVTFPTVTVAVAVDETASGVQREAAHTEKALLRIPEYLKEKDNFAALLSAIIDPIQDIEDATFDVLTGRTIDVAVDAQLDRLGSIVGRDRDGLSDDDYRRYIRAQIATNNSEGTTNEILTIARLVIYDVDVALQVLPQAPASFVLRASGAAVSADVAAIVAEFVGAAKSAGVRAIVEWSAVAPTAAFCFANGPGLGFGAGAFAGAINAP